MSELNSALASLIVWIVEVEQRLSKLEASE